MAYLGLKLAYKGRRLVRRLLTPSFNPPIVAPPLPDKWMTVNVRDTVMVDDDRAELATTRIEAEKRLNVGAIALLLVDCWQPENASLYHRRMGERMPLVLKVMAKSREHGVFIIHDPGFRPEADGIEVLQGEMYLRTGDGVPDGAKVQTECQKRGITTLFYVGFATNHCVIDNEAGMREMSARGFDCILIRDCTVGVEYPDTVEGYLATMVAVDRIEYLYGTSCTSEDFMRGLDNG